MPQTLYDLVFEGGGAKGSTFVGAMTAFYEKGYKPRRLVGTSAGAITATLLVAGFSPQDMLAAVNEQKDGKPRFSFFMDKPAIDDFSQADKDNSDTMNLFKQIDAPFIPGWLEEAFDRKFIDALMLSPHYRQLFCFVECGGLFAGDAFLAWIKEKLAAKGFNADITLGQFNAHPLVSNELSLVASDTDGREMLVLNHRTAPDCPVAWAVRMSMSIPFVWREVVWKAEWGGYLGKAITGHRIVDGGVLSNFPIALVDNQPEPGSYEQQVMGDTPANGAGSIGLMIDESLDVPGQPRKKEGLADEAGKLKAVQRVSRLIDTMTGSRDNAEIITHEKLVCRLPAGGYGTTEFDMEPSRLKALIDAGHAAMQQYLGA